MKKSSFLDTGLGVFLAAILANLLWGSASPCIKLGYQLFQISRFSSPGFVSPWRGF